MSTWCVKNKCINSTLTKSSHKVKANFRDSFEIDRAVEYEPFKWNYQSKQFGNNDYTTTYQEQRAKGQSHGRNFAKQLCPFVSSWLIVWVSMWNSACLEPCTFSVHPPTYHSSPFTIHQIFTKQRNITTVQIKMVKLLLYNTFLNTISINKLRKLKVKFPYALAPPLFKHLFRRS